MARGPAVALLALLTAFMTFTGSAQATYGGTPGTILAAGYGTPGMQRFDPSGKPLGMLDLEPADEWRDAHAPAWSPDGQQVAFLSYAPSDDEWRLAVVPATGGTPRVLYRQANEGIGSVAWSPDGRWLVYSEYRWSDPTGDLWLISVADGKRTPLLQEVEFGVEGPVSWAPDCSALVFAGWRQFDYLGGTSAHPTIDVWKLRFPDRTRERLTFDGIRPETLDYAPDGQTLLVGERVDVPVPGEENSWYMASRLQTMPANGGPRRTIHEPTGTDMVGPAAWTPDGSRILHVATGLGLWTMAPDGSDRRRLTADNTVDSYFAPRSQPSPPGPSGVSCNPLGAGTPPAGPPPPGSSSPQARPRPAPTPIPGAGRPERKASAALQRVSLGWLTNTRRPRLRLQVRVSATADAVISLERRVGTRWRATGRAQKRRVRKGTTSIWVTAMLGSRPWRAGRYRAVVTVGRTTKTSGSVAIQRVTRR